MKKHLKLILACFLFSSVGLVAQDNPAKKEKTQKSISFSSEKEKNQKIQQLETKIKTDLTDPTFPAEDLAKEKKELEAVKKAQVISNNPSKQ